MTAFSARSSNSAPSLAATSSIGTISGGSLISRSSPSTRRASFESARIRFLDSALATARSSVLRRLFVSWSLNRSSRRLMSSRRYQTSRLLSAARSRIRWRYSSVPASTTASRCASLEAEIARGDLEARREPLDVPLPGPGQRLVEVVDVEDQLAVGRGVAAEVGEVRVAAELGPEAGRRRGREVGGHHRGRPAVEGERGDQHARVSQRHELRDPRLRLALEHVHRVGPIRRRLPVAVGRARRRRSAPPCRASRARPGSPPPGPTVAPLRRSSP